MLILKRIKDGRFLMGHGGWSEEYPDALLFSDEEEEIACDLARSFRFRVDVIKDYGLETEQVIFHVE